jgi:hypothetical protein
MAKPIGFKSYMTVDYAPGMPDEIKYMAQKRKRKPNEGGATEDVEMEAISKSERIKRSQRMKKFAARLKFGKKRAMRKMADSKRLKKRVDRQARLAMIKKLTRGIPRSELSYERRAEIEKRLNKPVMKTRIQRLAKKMYPKVRKAEVQRKKG